MLEHVDYVCAEKDCEGCQFCQGGLWSCTVCDGFEGSMPSTCPGEAMTWEQGEAVYAGRLDYRYGQWLAVSSRYSPAYAYTADELVPGVTLGEAIRADEERHAALPMEPCS